MQSIKMLTVSQKQLTPTNSFKRQKKSSFSCISNPLLQKKCIKFQSRQISQKSRQQKLNVCACVSAGVADSGVLEFKEEDVKKENQFGKFLARVRGVMFYLFSLLISVPLFVVMVVMFPFTWLMDKWQRKNQHFVNGFWAQLSTKIFFPVKVHGRENLPAVGEPVVYVSNHESNLDIFSLLHLNRPFKFISKVANFLVPIIGWSMFMTGHIVLNRVDRRSQIKCLQQCGEFLKHGAAVLFFPEGTRTDVPGRIANFKKGAFSVAVKAGVPVVPITLVGTGDVMPNRDSSMLLYPDKIDIFVHPQIPTQGRDAQELCDEAYNIICSTRQKEIQVRKLKLVN
eukprot:TRINITY_DN14810_c0_g1_i4.p1 TRINITY_DN14810_c0_g1~~TRINITY_DN14810_c0_g1_i4.p1  ORF type:complete len:374 (+),score=35.19 TRINITY_DN14810_c0_g1_i4:105-1124(+)